MLIFLAIVVGPGCGFMLYALYQFSREARRFRHADPRRLSVTVVRAADGLTGSSKENALYALLRGRLKARSRRGENRSPRTSRTASLGFRPEPHTQR
jgi:hypothetical protein